VILHLFRVPDTFFEKALFCPRIIAHARLVIVEDVGWWHALNFFLQLCKILSDAGVNILAKFQITVPSLLVFTWYSVPIHKVLVPGYLLCYSLLVPLVMIQYTV
jgi:hypothetical protein